MKFRFHRGGLKESMLTVTTVNSLDELEELLGTKDISFDYIGMDKRINWNTYYVMADGYVAGMSDDNKFENEDPTNVK